MMSINLRHKINFSSYHIASGDNLLVGYRRTGMIFHSVIERLFATIFLLISLPLFIVVPVIIKLQDGGPVFYTGRRMGKDKQLFTMYKFRSLAPQAEQKIGAQLLHHSDNEETPAGRFLRDTRIDEIPQLLNVILGHMQFLGPRPERPALYAKHCAHIPGYDRRFAVKPGLFGYSQIFTPHSTPKRIRTLIDNRYIRKSKSIGFVVFWAAGAMFFLSLRLARKGLGLVQKRIRMTRTKERRVLERIRQSGHRLTIDNAGISTDSSHWRVIDINEECMYLYTNEQFQDTPIHFRLRIKVDAWLPHRVKLKTAWVTGSIFRHQEIDSNPFDNAYAINYSADSPLNRYMIDKYLLRKSIA